MLTYGIFLFLSVFPIIHPKGLTPIPEENMENTELLPLGTEQGREETCRATQAVVEKHPP